MITDLYKKNDIEQVVDLFLEVFEKEPWNDKWPTRKRAKAYIEDINDTPGFRGFVIRDQNQIVGAVLGYKMKWWAGDEFFVKEFFINSSTQGKGLGSKLHEFMVEQLKYEGVSSITLLTENNIPAYHFYKKQGMKESKETVFMVQNI